MVLSIGHAVAAAILTLLALTVLGCLILFYIFPNIMVKILFRLQASHAGMSIKYVGNTERVFCYGEKNKPQKNKMSMVLLHGFTSSKDQWLSCFRQLPSDIHLIAVDLPGHGGTSEPGEDDDISMDKVIDIIDEFLELVGMSGHQIHLIGSSLGGAVAGLYAAKYAHKVDRVSLVCPALETPVDTDLQLQVKRLKTLSDDEVSKKDIMFLCDDIQGIKDLLLSVCYNKKLMNLHQQIFKGILMWRLPRIPYFSRLCNSLKTVNKMDTLNIVAGNITVPSQVIWGRQDELIHVSGAEVLREKLADCKYVDIIEECGHGIHIDRPGSLVKHILKFYKDGELNKNS